MKIVHISDTHNKHKQVIVPEGDVLIHSGDISGLGRESEVENFFKWFTRQPHTYKIFIAGNHDRSFDDTKCEEGKRPSWLTNLLDNYLKYESMHYYLENSGCEIENIKFWGSPVTTWFRGEFWAFNKQRGLGIQKVWNKIPLDTNILITHGPSSLGLDWVDNSQEFIGDRDLADRITMLPNLKAHLFGHIHESYGIQYKDNIVISNGAICNLRYEPINKPNIIEV